MYSNFMLSHVFHGFILKYFLAIQPLNVSQLCIGLFSIFLSIAVFKEILIVTQ